MRQRIELRCLAAVVVVASLASIAQAVNIDTVIVDNPGNAADTNGYGSVDHVYQIGRYEVTAGQYCEFLNAVAKTDTYGLYNSEMNDYSTGCQITQNGDSGNYTYDFSGRPSGTESDWANRPVNYVSWGDAARFVNWLYNGQPTGAQDLTTTEDGSYFLNGATSNEDLESIARQSDATWVLPSVNEWYKAAYHKNNGVTGDYFAYPTSSDVAPGYIDDNGDFSRAGDGSFIEGGTDPGNYATYTDEEMSTWGIGSPYYRSIVGEHENSASPYGTFDQGGNVFECTETHPTYGHFLQGGAYYTPDYYLNSGYITPIFPADEFSNVGFRVAIVPEPGSIALLFLAMASLVFWKLRR